MVDDANNCFSVGGVSVRSSKMLKKCSRKRPFPKKAFLQSAGSLSCVSGNMMKLSLMTQLEAKKTLTEPYKGSFSPQRSIMTFQDVPKPGARLQSDV